MKGLNPSHGAPEQIFGMNSEQMPTLVDYSTERISLWLLVRSSVHLLSHLERHRDLGAEDLVW